MDTVAAEAYAPIHPNQEDLKPGDALTTKIYPGWVFEFIGTGAENNLDFRSEVLALNKDAKYITEDGVEKLVSYPSLLELLTYGGGDHAGFPWLHLACTPPVAMLGPVGIGEKSVNICVPALGALECTFAAYRICVHNLLGELGVLQDKPLTRIEKNFINKVCEVVPATTKAMWESCDNLANGYRALVETPFIKRVRGGDPSSWEVVDCAVSTKYLQQYFNEFEICIHRLKMFTYTCARIFISHTNPDSQTKEERQVHKMDMESIIKKPIARWQSTGRTCLTYDYLRKFLVNGTPRCSITLDLYVPKMSELPPALLGDLQKFNLGLQKRHSDFTEILFKPHPKYETQIYEQLYHIPIEKMQIKNDFDIEKAENDLNTLKL